MTKKLICTTLAVLLLVPSIVLASQESSQTQGDPSTKISALILQAEQHFEQGQAAYSEQDFDVARKEFDIAVDTILKGDFDVRTYPTLRKYFQGLIQRINTLETKALAQGVGLNEQVYEPSLQDELAQIELNEEDLAATQEQVPTPLLDFPFTLTPQVLQFIHYFSKNPNGRATMASGLQRAGKYLPLARRIFKEERVPLDLVWLAQAESNWRPRAKSWASAVGIWQFIPSTGSRYGLRQNQWIDERCGYEQATRASARYLRFLYERFLDWQLAMAGYNCGEGRIDRAIASTGYADFWYLYNRGLLPRETSNYIPIILAIILIAKDPARYGFDHIQPDPPLRFDSVAVNEPLDLRLISEITNTPYEIIEDLNPELKQGMTPPEMRYNLRIPQGTEGMFNNLMSRIPKDSRASWRVVRLKGGETLESLAEQHQLQPELIAEVNQIEADTVLRPGIPMVIPVEQTRASIRGRIEPPAVQIARRSTRQTMITVRPGDTLTRIAARYGISARDLARLNKLSTKAKLRAGQKLQLSLSGGKTTSAVSLSTGQPSSKEKNNGQQLSYVVKSGDSISDIAQRFQLSISDLKQWNGLESDVIKVGQKLSLTPNSKTQIKRTSKKKPSIYRVRRGDNLTDIAGRYGVSLSDLKEWNKLRSNKLLVGQRLIVSP